MGEEKNKLAHCLGVCFWKLGVTTFPGKGRSQDHKEIHGSLWANDARLFLFLFQFG